MPLEIVDNEFSKEDEMSFKSKARLKLKKMNMIRKQLLDNRIGMIRSVEEERGEVAVPEFDRPKAIARIPEVGGESDELSRLGSPPSKEFLSLRGNFESLTKMF